MVTLFVLMVLSGVGAFWAYRTGMIKKIPGFGTRKQQAVDVKKSPEQIFSQAMVEINEKIGADRALVDRLGERIRTGKGKLQFAREKLESIKTELSQGADSEDRVASLRKRFNDAKALIATLEPQLQEEEAAYLEASAILEKRREEAAALQRQWDVEKAKQVGLKISRDFGDDLVSGSGTIESARSLVADLGSQTKALKRGVDLNRDLLGEKSTPEVEPPPEDEFDRLIREAKSKGLEVSNEGDSQASKDSG